MGSARLTFVNSILPQNPLGRTGLKVSHLALGTAALGLDYGLPGSADFDRPSFEAAAGLVRRCLNAGVNFFDTAPAYGVAEEILGAALADAPDAVIASKAAVTSARDGAAPPEVLGELRRSVEASLKRLGRDRLDILKLHSATEEDLRDERLLRALDTLRAEGLTTATGATVYGETAALAAIGSGVIDVVQVAFNLLDQRASVRVFPEAGRQGVALVIRSALLKGALTPRWRNLPVGLAGLRRAVGRIIDDLELDESDLAATALRFCLGHGAPVSSVLIGVVSTEELDRALVAAAAGPLPSDLLSRIANCAIADEALLNPSHWPT